MINASLKPEIKSDGLAVGEDKDKADETIREQESKKLKLRQQIAFNVAMKDAERTRDANQPE